MKINWKLRFQNKFTLTAILLGGVSVIYQVLGLFGIAPTVTQNEVGQVVAAIIELLVLMGVVVDPTTSGLSDSDQALQYKQPK